MTTLESQNSATYDPQVREFTTELIARLQGQRIKSAVPANNLSYIKKDKSEVAKCGLKVTTDKEVTFGLFRWDILSSAVDYSDPKHGVAVDLTDCLMNRAAHEAFATAQGEEQWLKAIGDTITGHTCGALPYIGRKSDTGATYPGLVFVVTE